MTEITRHPLRVFFLLVSLLAIVISMYWWFYGRHIETTDNAYVQADITQISSQLSARIHQVHIEDNQFVEKGTLLIELEDKDFVYQIGKIKSHIESLQVQLDSLKTLRAQQQAQIEVFAADLKASHADHDRLYLNLSRFDALHKKGFASEEQITSLRANTRVASAAVQKARAALETQKLELDRLDEQEKNLRAQYEGANNDLSIAELNLSRTRIVAPIDGLIGHRSARAGQYVRPGEYLLSIVPDELWVQANFKETQVGKMRPGQKVTLSFDAVPGLRITATIDSLFPATGAQFSLLPPDNATGNFTKIVQRVPIKISIPDDPLYHQLMRPGLSVEVRVDLRD